MRQIVLNILIAFLWVLFQDQGSFLFSTFVSGYLIGLIIIYILHRFFGQEYLYQLITSSLSIIKYILFKTKDMNPGLLTYETELKSDWAITFLTILIIITPGSTVIRISKLTNKFFIHSIDISENEKANLLKSIKQYERLIMEVSR